LHATARSHMAEFGVSTPWQAFVQVRLRLYEQMLADPEVLRDNQWPHNVALLHEARQSSCQTALATMSRCKRAQRVLEVLDLKGEFDFVATRDDVEQGKPHPEIYQLVSQQLAVAPAECLVIEDSHSGVKAAVAAGMWCIAVTTPFTRKAIHAEGLLDERWIVDEPAVLTGVVQDMLEERSLD
jgi:beta-phosphoglucomutase